MSVDVLHCPGCRADLLRSDAEGLFHSPPPRSCPRCGMMAPLREAVFEIADFKPRPWPPADFQYVDRKAYRT